VRAPGVATSALRAIDVYVHFDDAGLYDVGTGAAITQGSPFCAQASVAVVVAICTPGLAALARLGRSRGAPPRAVFLTPTSTWAASARYPTCTSHMSAARQARVRRGRDVATARSALGLLVTLRTRRTEQ
jgi:hypothetical protein